jgi:hypothetical protein
MCLFLFFRSFFNDVLAAYISLAFIVYSAVHQRIPLLTAENQSPVHNMKTPTLVASSNRILVSHRHRRLFSIPKPMM